MSANVETDNSPSVTTLSLLGGRLCLDFANTIDPRAGNHPHEYLRSYFDLVKWGQYAGALSEEEMQRLSAVAPQRPADNAATFAQAIALRESIYRIFSAVADNRVPRQADLDELRNAFVTTMAHAGIVPADDGFAWDWIRDEPAPDAMLWPVIRSAVELLTSQEVKRVKECPGLGDCGWLFLDMSKNGSRQWCSMEGCGSRAKMRRQYARKRVRNRTGMN